MAVNKNLQMSLGKGKKYKAAIKELYLIQLLAYKVSIWLSLCRLNITLAKTFKIIKANIYIDSLYAQALEPVLSTPVSTNHLISATHYYYCPRFVDESTESQSGEERVQGRQQSYCYQAA